MKNNLGRVIFIVLTVQSLLCASVELIAPKTFMQGDSVEFKIVASGSDVKMPQITSIKNYTVQILGRSVQTHIVNGKKSGKLEQSYMFTPNKTVTIPSFDVRVDGKVVKTQAQTIQMQKVQKTISNLFDFEIKVDKKELYVGEMIKLDLVFRYRKDINVVDLQFQRPVFEGFWVKQLKDKSLINDPNPQYHYQTLQYLLFPQKSGKLEIGPLKIKVVTLNANSANSFFLNDSTNAQSVYSNSIMLDVKKTPQNVALVGNFKVKSFVDKKEVALGEPISLKVEISGEGNMDDIPNLSLDIPQATIYDNPPTKNFEYKDNVYQGKYTKVFSIVPSKSFTIDPIALQYFDPKTNKVKTIQTNKYDIVVKDSTKKKSSSKLEVQSEISTQNKPMQVKEKVVYFLLGVGSAIVIVLLYIFIRKFSNKKNKEDNIPLYKRVSQSKSKKQLLQIMAAYINIDEDLDKIIYTLEQTQDSKELKQLQKKILQLIKEKNKKGIL